MTLRETISACRMMFWPTVAALLFMCAIGFSFELLFHKSPRMPEPRIREAPYLVPKPDSCVMAAPCTRCGCRDGESCGSWGEQADKVRCVP